MLTEAVASRGDIAKFVEDEVFQRELDGANEPVKAHLRRGKADELGHQDNCAAKDDKGIRSDQVNQHPPATMTVNARNRSQSAGSFSDIDAADDKLLDEQPKQRYLVVDIRRKPHSRA